MSSLSCPTRTLYTVDIQVGTKIAGTVTISEMSAVIAPVKSTSTYTLTEATDVSGVFNSFPQAS